MSLDLLALDAQVKLAAVSWAKWRDRTDLEGARSSDPFSVTRAVTGQSLLCELRDHKPTPFEAGLHAGLMRWVYALLQARLSIPYRLEVLALRNKHVDVPAFAETRNFRSLLEGTVREPALRSNEYSKALTELAGSLAGVERRALEVRVEVARRIGFAHPDEPYRLDGDELSFARVFVTASADCANDAVRLDRAYLPPIAYARGELALDAAEGWPAHLSIRWLEDVFSGFSGVLKRLPVFSPPGVWGASSFARALGTLGLQMRLHHVLQSKLPFAERAHPRNLEGQTLAIALGLLVLSPAFHFRALGLSRGAARDQARRCGGALLLSSRRMLAASAVRADEWSVEDAAHAVYGAEPTNLTAAILFGEPRAWALADGIAFTNLMVNRFDEDWFRNPRAHQFLIDRASAPSFATDRVALPTAIQCAQWFESRV